MNRFRSFRVLCVAAPLLFCFAQRAPGAPPTTAPTTRPAGVILSVGGKVPHPLALTAEMFAAIPHQEIKVKNRDGNEVVYSGVPAEAVLKEAGLPLGGARPQKESLTLCVVVEAADGYKVVFSLPELDEQLSGRQFLLADRRHGHSLDPAEGPLRLIVPGDSRPVRWVRQVTVFRVERP